MLEAAIRLARMRREGGGVWRITLIVEGFDDEFMILVSQKYHEEVAGMLARLMIARELRQHFWHVHVQGAERIS